jgi:hypothetical protein
VEKNQVTTKIFYDEMPGDFCEDSQALAEPFLNVQRSDGTEKSGSSILAEIFLKVALILKKVSSKRP